MLTTRKVKGRIHVFHVRGYRKTFLESFKTKKDALTFIREFK